MSWTERQQRMLVEMGLPGWFAPRQEGRPPKVSESDQPINAVNADNAVNAADEPLAAPPPAAVTLTLPELDRASVPEVDASGAAATLAWPALRDAVAACTACGLHRSRRQTVFGVGHPQADWMVVGEAPGEQEDLQGEPFVGRSGQLLDNMLRALQLSRAEGPPGRQVFIANTLKCRPPGNRNPTPQELAACEPFLIRQIALVQPRIILAMGRFAVQRLLRSDEPIGRLRGRIHHYQGVPLVVTYHPAYLLRNPQDKARAWDDLCLAAEAAAGPVAVMAAVSPTAT